MGCTSSKAAQGGDMNSFKAEHEKSLRNVPNESAPAGKEEKNPSDSDEVVQGVALILIPSLLKLLECLEHEKDIYTSVAKERGLESFVDLADMNDIALLLKKTFRCREPSSMSSKLEVYRDILKGSERATASTMAWPHQTEFVPAMQKALAKTQASLKESVKHCQTSEEKKNLLFFDGFLNVLQGDISTEEKLQASIDAFGM